MKKLSLFKGKRLIAAFIVITCSLIVVFYLLRVTDFSKHGAVLMAIMATNIYLFTLDFLRLNKFFFRYENNTIQWHFPSMKKKCKIILEGNISEVRQDWKGIHFMNNNKQHSIKTDGLSNRQKQTIVNSLKDYPSFLS